MSDPSGSRTSAAAVPRVSLWQAGCEVWCCALVDGSFGRRLDDGFIRDGLGRAGVGLDATSGGPSRPHGSGISRGDEIRLSRSGALLSVSHGSESGWGSYGCGSSLAARHPPFLGYRASSSPRHPRFRKCCLCLRRVLLPGIKVGATGCIYLRRPKGLTQGGPKTPQTHKSEQGKGGMKARYSSSSLQTLRPPRAIEADSCNQEELGTGVSWGCKQAS